MIWVIISCYLEEIFVKEFFHVLVINLKGWWILELIHSVLKLKWKGNKKGSFSVRNCEINKVKLILNEIVAHHKSSNLLISILVKPFSILREMFVELFPHLKGDLGLSKYEFNINGTGIFRELINQSSLDFSCHFGVYLINSTKFFYWAINDWLF